MYCNFSNLVWALLYNDMSAGAWDDGHGCSYPPRRLRPKCPSRLPAPAPPLSHPCHSVIGRWLLLVAAGETSAGESLKRLCATARSPVRWGERCAHSARPLRSFPALTRAWGPVPGAGQVPHTRPRRLLAYAPPAPCGLTRLHVHLLRHQGAVEEQRGGALLVARLVEEVQDEVLGLAVVAVQQVLEELRVGEAEGLVHAVAHPQHPQVVHGAAPRRASGDSGEARGREPVATAPRTRAPRQRPPRAWAARARRRRPPTSPSPRSATLLGRTRRSPGRATAGPAVHPERCPVIPSTALRMSPLKKPRQGR